MFEDCLAGGFFRLEIRVFFIYGEAILDRTIQGDLIYMYKVIMWVPHVVFPSQNINTPFSLKSILAIEHEQK